MFSVLKCLLYKLNTLLKRQQKQVNNIHIFTLHTNDHFSRITSFHEQNNEPVTQQCKHTVLFQIQDDDVCTTSIGL